MNATTTGVEPIAPERSEPATALAPPTAVAPLNGEQPPLARSADERPEIAQPAIAKPTIAPSDGERPASTQSAIARANVAASDGEHLAIAQPMISRPSVAPSDRAPVAFSLPVREQQQFEADEHFAPPANPACDNCGAAITGKYCAQCGQHYEPHIHSLGHFLTEAAENITHADSRVWLTLWPLLAKPGFLTKEFFEGHRARYLPPFRLYLVVSAIFFLLWAAIPSHDNFFATMPDTEELVPLNKSAEKEVTASPLAESPQQRADRICKDGRYSGPFEALINPKVVDGCKKVVIDNGRSFLHAFFTNIPRSLFILLPGLAVVMKLMYWRPKRYYVEHLLFFVHNHAAVFLIMALYLLLSKGVEPFMPTWPLTMAVWLYLFWYSYKSMRRFYGQGKWLTRAKFFMLGTTYFTGAMTLLIFIAFFSFMTI
jgi:hypothetical protein